MKQEKPEKPMTFAREEAAKAWCGKNTSGITMDVELAEEFTRILIDYMYAPHLGYATIEELFEEIGTRIEKKEK